MNKEIMKAMNSTQKENTIKKWWGKNGYKVMRVILFPVWFAEVANKKYNSYMNKKQVWDEQRADEILSYYIPRVAEFNKEDNSFYFFDNGMGWNRKKYIKRRDRRFWKVNVGWWGGKIRTHLIEKFELEGFTKEVGQCWDGWTEITFILKEGNN